MYINSNLKIVNIISIGMKLINIISLRKSDRQFKKKNSNKHLLISIFEYHVSYPNLHYRHSLFNCDTTM